MLWILDLRMCVWDTGQAGLAGQVQQQGLQLEGMDLHYSTITWADKFMLFIKSRVDPKCDST